LQAAGLGKAVLPWRVPERGVAGHARAQRFQRRLADWLREHVVPILRRRDRRGIEQAGVVQAGPRSVAGARHQPGADRSEEHIAQHRQEVRVLLDWKALEGALPDVPAAMVVAVIATHVAGQPPLPAGAELVRLAGLHHDAEMIRQHAHGKQADGHACLGGGQPIEKGRGVSNPS